MADTLSVCSEPAISKEMSEAGAQALFDVLAFAAEVKNNVGWYAARDAADAIYAAMLAAEAGGSCKP